MKFLCVLIASATILSSVVTHAEMRASVGPLSIQARVQPDGNYRLYLYSEGNPISQIGHYEISKADLIANRSYQNLVWRIERGIELTVVSSAGGIVELGCVMTGAGVLASSFCFGVPAALSYAITSSLMWPDLHFAVAKALNVDNLLPGVEIRPVSVDLVQVAQALEVLIDAQPTTAPAANVSTK